jgi:hypothetical protein
VARIGDQLALHGEPSGAAGGDVSENEVQWVRWRRLRPSPHPVARASILSGDSVGNHGMRPLTAAQRREIDPVYADELEAGIAGGAARAAIRNERMNDGRKASCHGPAAGAKGARQGDFRRRASLVLPQAGKQQGAFKIAQIFSRITNCLAGRGSRI